MEESYEKGQKNIKHRENSDWKQITFREPCRRDAGGRGMSASGMRCYQT